MSAPPAEVPPAVAKMPKPPGDSAAEDLDKPQGRQLFSDVVGRNPDIWAGAVYLPRDYKNTQDTIRAEGGEKKIKGRTSSGAIIEAMDIDFRRSESRLVLADDGKGNLGDSKEWHDTDKVKGVSISVTTGDNGTERTVSLFIPDNSAASRVEREYQITIEIRGKPLVILKPGDEGFEVAMSEINYYLDDDVEWQTPTVFEDA